MTIRTINIPATTRARPGRWTRLMAVSVALDAPPDGSQPRAQA